MNKILIFSAFTLGLLLSACGHNATLTSSPAAPSGEPSATLAGGTAASETLSPLGVAAATTLSAGQSVQFSVTVNSSAPTAGQLIWTTTNSGIVKVTQTGLATAVAPGSATVRAALATNRASYIDFPVTVVAATSTTPPPTTTPPSTFAQRVLTLTNSARAVARTCGTTSYAAAPALTYNAQLAQAAQGHANDMATKNYFNHASQDGRTFAQRISATGYAWRTIGENIAAGQTTPEAVVSGWLQSPGHCANIMNPAFKELGVGYAYSATSTYKHYWVQDFGAR